MSGSDDPLGSFSACQTLWAKGAQQGNKEDLDSFTLDMGLRGWSIGVQTRRPGRVTPAELGSRGVGVRVGVCYSSVYTPQSQAQVVPGS